MQNKPSNDQHKSIYYRLRRSDPHERLSARLRHFSFGAAVFFVVAAACCMAAWNGLRRRLPPFSTRSATLR